MKYPVLDNLHHDGEAYAPGDTVELTDEQAEPLRWLRVIGSPLTEKPAKTADDKKAKADA
jgi:hypothetical protein